ncbi:hypothetical protein ES703_35152 [subsurface metagenome]
MLELPSKGKGREDSLLAFARELRNIQRQIDFKVSARGWCYQLEQFGLITKGQFDRVENIINHDLRAKGYLPIDFVAAEESRKFSGVETPMTETPSEFMKRFLEETLECENYYTPDWWDGEEFYIQMVVEKIDLKSLFEPMCRGYHIPIATSKGWSSMLQRAEYARRFKEAEDMGLKCVLLYCGDHDPDGLRISEALRANLDDLAFIRWGDGERGYDPADLKIDRFGLNYDFIVANNLSWINNLITGSKKDLASPSHKNHYLPYVQEYLATVGERKCEANALVVAPAQGRQLCKEAIENYLGQDAVGRFKARWQVISDKMESVREKAGVRDAVEEAIKMIGEED